MDATSRPNLHRFKMSGRQIEWALAPDAAGTLIDIRSDDGRFALRVAVSQNDWPLIGPLAVVGSEFPLGVPHNEGAFIFDPSVRVRHGFVHSGVIRALVDSCTRRWKSRRHPLSASWRERFRLPLEIYPEGNEERATRMAAEAARHRAEEVERARLDAVAAKDARITRAVCPWCGKPCPTYRVTCKHCGKQVRTTARS